MTDMQLPDDVRDALLPLIATTPKDWLLANLAPILLAEGAKQQREIDAGIAETRWDAMFETDQGHRVAQLTGARVATAIRNQGQQ